MKTNKPMGLGLLTRVFENDQECNFVVSALVFFPFQAPRRLLPEVSMWKFAADQLGKDATIDACMPKIRGEILVHGSAFPPGGAKPACSVKVELGSINKELWAVGDRTWEANGSTPPVPFEAMPLGWESAFGGPDYPSNPLGKGAAPIQGPKGAVHPLPNLEDPKRLLRTPRDRPQPVGFGAYDDMWPQRFKRLGTYDQKWLEKRFPGFAEDFDPAYFNVAPEDQQLAAGYFRGDEAFVVENMHPAIRRLEGRLPAVMTRCFIARRGATDEIEELPMRLDTVRLFPHMQRGMLVYRAVTRVDEDDAADVVDLLLACDPLEDPRPRGHYEEARRNRLDKRKGALYALRDKDLMPPPPADAPKLSEDDWNDTAPLLEMEFAALKNTRRYLQGKIEAAKEECASHGFPPPEGIDDALPPENMPPKSFDELPEYFEQLDAQLDAADADTAAQRKATDELAREQCAAEGLDYDALVAGAAKGGPPEFSADAELEKLRDLAELSRNTGGMLPDIEARVSDPSVEEQLREAEKRIFWAYRKFTQHMPAAAYLGPDASAGVRADVIAAHAAGQSLARRDLTGADLSGLDLTGADLGEALLESASLAGAKLAGATLSGATLARADLTGADLTGATLVDTNFSLAKLRSATLARADLTDAELSHADMTGASLAGAQMKRARLEGATFQGANLEGVDLAGTRIYQADLSGLKLAGANLKEAILHEVTLDQTDLTGANLTSATLIAVHGTGTVLRDAVLVNLRCVLACALPEADARGANLEGANLRGVDLTRADFSTARMRGADLSECKMMEAKLYRVVAENARFSKTDLSNATLTSATLMYAIFERAKIFGADFRGANLFRADMAKARGDKATNFKDANIKQTRVVAAPPAKPKDAPSEPR